MCNIYGMTLGTENDKKVRGKLINVSGTFIRESRVLVPNPQRSHKWKSIDITLWKNDLLYSSI